MTIVLLILRQVCRVILKKSLPYTVFSLRHLDSQYSHSIMLIKNISGTLGKDNLTLIFLLTIELGTLKCKPTISLTIPDYPVLQRYMCIPSKT